MTAEPDIAAMEQLRRLEQGIDKLVEDVGDVKHRVAAIEILVAMLHRDFLSHSDRIGRVEERLEQIERCLEWRCI